MIYFRLCFSFSCSGYDLTLIKKSHTRNCYLFSQKFLLKTKTYKLLLVTVVAQFTAKTANSEKAIYFLSLMSCSINKLKSHMLFTCKHFMSSDFTWKKFLLQRMGGCVCVWRREGRGGVAYTYYLYSPAFIKHYSIKYLLFIYRLRYFKFCIKYFEHK